MLDRVENIAHKRHGVDVIGFWLPEGRAPPTSFAEKLLARGQLINYNLDSEALDFQFPKPYVAMTDFLHRATVNLKGAKNKL